MRVRIVSYEDVDAWILGKFARKLHEELVKLGVEAEIGRQPDRTADINHHIIYLDYDDSNPGPVDTLMITHIDTPGKLKQILRQLKVAHAGICMSSEMMKVLVNGGAEPRKVCYINPAHDGLIRKKKTSIGITCKVHADGRKRESFLLKLGKTIDPELFRFTIMGQGWNEIVKELVNRGLEIEYHETFDYEKYTQLIPKLDYYLYLGQDEGSMGFVDALAAGVKTIVTPQGYHLDARGGITHSFNTLEELQNILETIARERKLLTDSVKDWTWSHYARKHLEVWDYLLTGKMSTSGYHDGINSFGNKGLLQPNVWDKVAARYKILKITGSRFFHSKDKIGKIRRKLKM